MAWAAANLYEGDGTKKSQCSASSEYSATYLAVNAFDAAAGGVDDCWISSDANTPEVDGSCYLEFDFTARMYIGGVQLQRRTSTAGQMTNYPKDIVVKCKKDEDADWTTVKTVALTSPADAAWGDEVAFNPIYSTHWDMLRIEFHSVHYRGVVGWNVCVKEVRFLGRATCGPLTVFYRADLNGTIVAEATGSQNDYGYVGVTGEGESALVTEFAMGYREHDRYSDSADHRFSWDGTKLALKMEEYIYSNRSAGYLQAVFDPADIHGLHLAYKVNVEDTGVADLYLRVTDGAYDYASLVDYPQDLAPINKGVGSLQTIASQTTDAGSVTKTGVTQLDVDGGSEALVTLRLEHLKNTDSGVAAQCYVYYLNLSDIGIIDTYRGAVDLPIMPFLGCAVDFSGDVSLPTFVIDSVCEGGVGFATLPAPKPEQITNEITMTAGFALTGEAYILLLGEAELPVPQMYGVMGGSQNALLPTLAFEGRAQRGILGLGEVDLPTLGAVGYTGGNGILKASFGIEGAGYVGHVAAGYAELPDFVLQGEASITQMASGEANLPAPLSLGSWVAQKVTRGNVELGFTLTARAVVGAIAVGDAELGFELTGEGSVSCLGVMNVQLPLPIPEGQIRDAAIARSGLLRFHRGF